VKSIRARLAFGLILGLTPLFIASGWALHATAKRNLFQKEHAALEVKAAAVAAAVGFEHGVIEVQSPARTSSGFARTKHPDYFALLDVHDRVLTASPSAEPTGWTPPLAELVEGQATRVTLPGGREGIATILVLHPGTDLEEEASEEPLVRAQLESGLRVVVADDVGDIREEIEHLDTGIAAVFGAALIGAFAIVFLVLRTHLRPLDRIAAQAQGIDDAHLDRRFETGPLPSELAPVRDRLNDLLARLEDSFARETRFNTAVAHELRTPIAELRTLAEVALRWPDAQAPTRVVRDVLSVAVRMQSLVGTLLLLRRIESGHEPLETQPVRLRALLAEAIAQRREQASARAVEVRQDATDDVIVTTQPQLLELLVDNWIANAVEYAPRGSIIEASVERQNGSFVLEIANDAPQLSASDVSRMFEPFWRKDDARSDDLHSGLGLALTKSVAETLGFDAVASLEGARLHMRLRGPS
jgi:two-component system sensor histidine kinase QseC